MYFIRPFSAKTEVISETTEKAISFRKWLWIFQLFRTSVGSFRKGEENMYKSFSMELAGRTLTVDIGRVAKQANGAALMHYGDTTVLSTATASDKPREGIDFFPLSVEYEEKLYGVG